MAKKQVFEDAYKAQRFADKAKIFASKAQKRKDKAKACAKREAIMFS